MDRSVIADRDKDRLIGAVRTVHTASASSGGGTGEEAGMPFQPAHTVIYNEAGNKTKEAFYTPDGRLSEVSFFKYDPVGKIIEQTRRKAAGGLLDYTTYVYDEGGRETGRIYTSTRGLIKRLKADIRYAESGRKSEEIWRLEDGTLSHRYQYIYGPAGALARRILHKHSADGTVNEEGHSVYDSAGNLVEYYNLDGGGRILDNRYVYTYDSRGNKTSHETYNPDGSLYSKAVYDYDFDQVGNWTRQREAREPGGTLGPAVLITRRTIDYF
jgi:hypothetical protein